MVKVILFIFLIFYLLVLILRWWLQLRLKKLREAFQMKTQTPSGKTVDAEYYEVTYPEKQESEQK